ncbi:hypothetical protein D3C72_1769050 [compost metagenome]
MWSQWMWSRPVVSRIAVLEKRGAPRVANEFSKCGMPCVTKVRASVPSSQRGRTRPSQASRKLGRSGVVKPARTLFSRFAQTGMSTVTTRWRKPAPAMRATRPSMRAASPGR